MSITCLLYLSITVYYRSISYVCTCLYLCMTCLLPVYFLSIHVYIYLGMHPYYTPIHSFAPLCTHSNKSILSSPCAPHPLQLRTATSDVVHCGTQAAPKVCASNIIVSIQRQGHGASSLIVTQNASSDYSTTLFLCNHNSNHNFYNLICVILVLHFIILCYVDIVYLWNIDLCKYLVITKNSNINTC